MFFHRHWVIICVGFVCGAFFAKIQWITWALLPVIISIIVIFLLINYQKRIRYAENIGIFLFSFIIGSLSYLLHPYPQEGDDFFVWLRQQQPNIYVEVEGYVTENTLFDPINKQIRFVINISKVKEKNTWKNIKGKALVLYKDAQSPIYTHTRLRLSGKTSLYLSPVNEILSDYETYLRSHRIYSLIFVYAPQIQTIHTYTFSPFYHISRLQQYFYERIIQYTPTSIRDMTRAIWLGDRSGLDYKEEQNFILTGTIHILAISGLHIGLVFWFTQVAIRAIFKTRRRLADIPALLLCVFYALISGAHGSSLRAILMLLIYELYVFSRRNADILTTLSITATLLFLWSTDLIWDIGTEMSILAVVSIILFNEPISKLLRIFPWTIRSYFSAIISAQILLLPLLITINSQINALNPVYNLFVVPSITLYLMTSICGLAFIFIPFLPTLFFYASGVFLIFIQSLCKWGSSFSYT
ncbi:MAG: ComEC/Rec2 family competence protein, partial [Candidatus Hydrogenedens sp.]